MLTNRDVSPALAQYAPSHPGRRMQQRHLAPPPLPEIDRAELAVCATPACPQARWSRRGIGDEQIRRTIIDRIGRIPSAATCRPRITPMRSPSTTASAWSWVTYSAVIPVCLRITRRSSRSPQAQFCIEVRQGLVEQQQFGPVHDAGPRPRAASGRPTMRPPASAYSDDRPSSSASSTLRRASPRESFRCLERIDHVLRTVICATPHRTETPCRARAARRHQNAAFGVTIRPWPAMLISPDVGCSSPRDAAQRRGLAAAGGPSRTTISPAGTAKLTPVDRRPADRKLLSQVGNFERRYHDALSSYADRSTAVTEGLCPSPRPGRVQLYVLVKLGNQTRTTLGSKPSGIDRRFFNEVRLPSSLIMKACPLFRQAPVQKNSFAAWDATRSSECRGVGIDRCDPRREENLDRRAVLLLRIDRVVEQRPHRHLSAYQRVRHRRTRGIEIGWVDACLAQKSSPSTCRSNMMRVQVVPPGLGKHLPGSHLCHTAFGQVHPGFGATSQARYCRRSTRPA